MDKKLKDLAESFALFDSWEDRYRYLIDLGQRLEGVSADEKNAENKVEGCTSQVWLIPEIRDGKFYFRADSDAMIVKGLIYILHEAYNGKDLAAVKDVDIEEAFERLGLDKHLSPNRRNGFFAMINRIKALAAAG